MPRGDYQHLKADPEDGTVHIANLLLEALSIASLNGVQKGLILFVWRRTYGWTSGKQKFKTDRITLGEFAEAVHTQKSYVSKMLKALIEANVIFSESDKEDNRYKRYGMNTNISTWGPSAIDLEALAEATHNQVFVHSTRQQKSLYKSAMVIQTYNSYTNEQPLHKRRTKRLHKCIRKRLYKRITFMAPKVASRLGLSALEIKKKEISSSLLKEKEIHLTFMGMADEIESRIQIQTGDPYFKLIKRDYELLKNMMNDGITADQLFRTLDTGYAKYKPRFQGDTVKNLSYFRPIAYEIRERDLARQEAAATSLSVVVRTKTQEASSKNGRHTRGSPTPEQDSDWSEIENRFYT